MKLLDLANAIAPGCEFEKVGVRPGEKLHEVLITPDDARSTIEYDDYFAILPHWKSLTDEITSTERRCSDEFVYTSETNDRWLTPADLRSLSMDEER